MTNSQYAGIAAVERKKLSGQAIELASLAEWERGHAALFSSPEFQQMQAEMGPDVPFVSGRTEFNSIEKNFDE